MVQGNKLVSQYRLGIMTNASLLHAILPLHPSPARTATRRSRYPQVISGLCKLLTAAGLLLASQPSFAQNFDYSLQMGPRYFPGEDRPEPQNKRAAYNTAQVITINSGFFPQQNASPSLFKSTGDGIYQFLDNPVDTIKNAGLGAISVGLDAMGALGALEDSIAFVKEKTEYDFGDCTHASITQQFQLQSCLADDAALSLQSDYELEKMQIQLRWSF